MEIMTLFLVLVYILLGAILVWGAYHRWGWLVDPPLWMAFFYTQALWKLIFGREGCRIITMLFGVIFFILPLFFLVIEGAK